MGQSLAIEVPRFQYFPRGHSNGVAVPEVQINPLGQGAQSLGFYAFFKLLYVPAGQGYIFSFVEPAKQ